MVKCDEPSEEGAVVMLRGLRKKYEESHDVRIRDEAVVSAAKYSHRYISGRLLPDKAVDLLDTAAARVRVSLSAKPNSLDDAERRIATLEREVNSLNRDIEEGEKIEPVRLEELAAEIEGLREKAAEITERWVAEKEIADKIMAAQEELAIARGDATPSEDDEEAEAPAAEPRDPKVIQAEIAENLAALQEAQGNDPLVHIDVSTDVIARVVADWTGIPVGNMVRDEVASILTLGDRLKERIIGQDHAVDALSEGVRAAKSGISNPDTPMGVFLLVGPSGVGKTETALAVADTLFGGERFMTSINMSEFQEAHTVSRLVGSPPGYVGYGEGGVLTEAVRKRPYSVVLLDETEKSHLDVMNIFYQVFDKGMLADGEGRIIDFKNTIVFLTSNLATNEIMEATADGTARIDWEELTTIIRPVLFEALQAGASGAHERRAFLSARGRGDEHDRAAEARSAGQAADAKPQDGVFFRRRRCQYDRGALHGGGDGRSQYRPHHERYASASRVDGDSRTDERGRSAGALESRHRRRRRFQDELFVERRRV